ncbi:MAG: NOP5/NOP56 family protein [Halorhabdus sp.]
MTEDTPEDTGWFDDIAPGDVTAAAIAIRDGSATESCAWPEMAIDAGFATDEADYYDRLRAATLQATDQAVTEQERADDRQLLHAVRAMDDADAMANELAERVAEWAGTRFDDAGTGVEYARELATREPTDPTEERLIGLARRVGELAEEATSLRRHIQSTAPDVAPNLSALAGPVLAARLISLAGGLESLAKKPSGTVQVLGAEDALFAHLQGSAPSPKHGVIYTHEYVRGTDPDERGSAARALAGKLTIAARIDHYSGDRRPELDTELDDRIATIRSRGEQA